MVYHPPPVSRADRERLLGQRGAVVWFTGLSGSGKSTVAGAVLRRLHDAGRLAYLLDGDNVRHGLCGDLGFSPEDRAENVRRLAEAAALLADAGVLTLVAAAAPTVPTGPGPARRWGRIASSRSTWPRPLRSAAPGIPRGCTAGPSAGRSGG